MNWFAQIGALLGFSMRTIGSRKGSAASAIFGIAGVVAVLIGVLSIGEGFSKVMTIAGSDDTAMVFRSGADSEMSSVLSGDSADLIADAPGVARIGDQRLVSPELFVIISLPKRSTNTDANVPMRGVEKAAFGVRPEVKITQGRAFEWGRNEVIVGRAALAEFGGTDLGSDLQIGQNKWKVVGIFDAGGSIAESELWADAAVLAPAYRRGNSYQTAMVKLASAGSYQQFKDALTSDPRLNVKVQRETEYFGAQTRMIRLMVTGLAFLVSGLMGLGALFGALNTMYTAVAARSREIATLEALGFGGSVILVSVMIEALLLALTGGVIGAVIAYLAFDGFQAATMNWQSFSQVAFAFEVNGRLMALAIAYALAIGFVGGLFPAIRAARLPVSVALREP